MTDPDSPYNGSPYTAHPAVLTMASLEDCYVSALTLLADRRARLEGEDPRGFAVFTLENRELEHLVEKLKGDGSPVGRVLRQQLEAALDSWAKANEATV